MSMPRMRPLVMLPLVLLCGCAPETGPTVGMATTTSTPAVIPAPPTATPIPMPTPTPEPVPTREPTPIIPVDPSGLSPEGPWLVYGPYWGGSLHIVNEDGSGQTQMAGTIFDGSDPASLADPSNQFAWVGGTEYLIRPELAEAIAINSQPSPSDPFQPDSRFDGISHTWDGKLGFLTSVYKDYKDGHFELTVHGLPGGDIVDRFPAILCDECGIGDTYWSPSGRYFAFTGSLDSPSHNLYVYDTLKKRLRRLTRGMETVDKINWSPHGKYLAFVLAQDSPSSHLMIYDVAEDATRRVSGWADPVVWTRWSPADEWILAEVVVETDDAGDGTTLALWSVKIVSEEAQWLYSRQTTMWGEGVPRLTFGNSWLDTHRLELSVYVDDIESRSSEELVFADLATGKVQGLTAWPNMGSALDPESLVVVIRVHERALKEWGYSPVELAWYEGPGIYLISPPGTTPMLVAEEEGYVEWYLKWDQRLGMFTTEAGCERAEAGGGILTVDRSGRTHCIEKAVPTTSRVVIDQNGRTHRIEMWAEGQPDRARVSPDGKWQVLEEEGIWLRTSEGETVGQVNEAESGQVIWRPDSRGFFLAANGALSYVSVPDLSVRLVDSQANYRLGYQWLTRDVP